MTPADWGILVAVVAGWASNMGLSYYLWTQLNSARNLISAETKRREAHTKHFEQLTNPDAIIADMERGADIIEARNANRLTKPRADAGPPARVARPKLRSKLPSRWNPPRR